MRMMKMTTFSSASLTTIVLGVMLGMVLAGTVVEAGPTVRHVPSTHRYMPRSFLQVDTSDIDRWRPVITQAASEALATINAELRPKHDPEAQLQLDRVDVTDVQVGRTLKFSGVAEVSHYDERRPSAYAITQHAPFSLLRPPQYLSNLWTLPSLTQEQQHQQRTTQVISLGHSSSGASSSGSADLPKPDESPVFPEFDVEGPLVLYLDQLLYDPVMRLPRQVDAGAVRVIKIGPGVRLRVSGVSEMTLKSSLEVASSLRILADASDEAEASRMMLDHAAQPHIELKLANLGRDFRVWSTSQDRVKVKRRSANVVELLSPTAETDHPRSAQQGQTTAIAEADRQQDQSLTQQTWVLSHSNLLREVARTFEQAMAEHAEGNAALRRVVEGVAEAVNVLVIPINVKDPLDGGHVSQWQVIVSRGADGKSTLVSHHQLADQEAVPLSVAPSVLHNTTWPAIVQAFHPHVHQQAAH